MVGEIIGLRCAGQITEVVSLKNRDWQCVVDVVVEHEVKIGEVFQESLFAADVEI